MQLSKPIDRIIRKKEMLELVGVSNVTLWRWEKEGQFPKRVALGPQLKGWRESDYNAWVEARQ